jgi:hypothetical protein
VVHASPVEKNTGELAGGRGVKSEATGGEHGTVVVACDRQSGDAADVGVSLHEVDEVGARNGFDGAGDEGFRADAVEGSFVQSGEAKDIAGTRDAEEEETALAGGGGDFDVAAADDQEVVGG